MKEIIENLNLDNIIRLRVSNIQEFNYTLIDKDEKEYTISIEFYDLEDPVIIGDYLYISNKLLDKKYEEYSNFYYFGPMNKQYGKSLRNKDTLETDIIAIKKAGQKNVFLQKYYG